MNIDIELKIPAVREGAIEKLWIIELESPPDEGLTAKLTCLFGN